VSKELAGITKRIRREISELEKIREHALRRWQKTAKDKDYLGSVAFDLQSFYIEGLPRAVDLARQDFLRFTEFLEESMQDAV
jgi:hypothetical protein